MKEIQTDPVPKKGWTIDLDFESDPTASKFKDTFLSRANTGTAVNFVISDAARAQGCRIPDHPQILYRLQNFYMLRLIASDPNLELILRQYRTQNKLESRLEFDFPVGQVIESRSGTFDPMKYKIKGKPLTVEFTVVRSDGHRPLMSGFPDRDARERGMLIVDELDAVYDLTFADADYEKAEFLERIYGVVRVTGLREVLQSYLDSETPTSPLRPDREGFNRDHEFSGALLKYLGDQLRPIYEKERKLVEEGETGELSAESKRRVEDALKELNKYFNRVTDLGGEGDGVDPKDVPEPADAVSFYPPHARLVADRPRQVLLLVREDVVTEGAEVLASASDGLSVQPEKEAINTKICPRWSVHKKFYAVKFTISASALGTKGQITAMVQGKGNNVLEAIFRVDDVLTEAVLQPPETLEFRPTIANGRPGRRNSLALYVNPKLISPGHYVRIRLTKKTGGISLINPQGNSVEDFDVKLDAEKHRVKGQPVLKVLVPWTGSAWNQHGNIEAAVKIGANSLVATATIWLDEPDEDGGFFKDIKYDEIDPKAPSQFAAGVVTINTKDDLNRIIFGGNKQDFDKRLSVAPEAQQRLAALLLEEASFRALEQLYKENKLNFAHRREIGEVHEKIDEYKFESSVDVYRALSKLR